MLAERSPVFHKLFMDSLEDRTIEIKDYDFATFKLFIDCVMDFQECSVIDALLLFPIARKYETKSFIKKCLDILTPKELNENVCLSLNLALCCECEELQENIVSFLANEYLIYRIFHEENFYSILEPESVCELLKHVDMDSYILQTVFEWGSDYLKKRNKSMDLKTFFIQNGIINFLKIYAFETTQALFDFNKSELGNHFYSILDVERYFEYFGKYTDLRKCSWINVKGGDTITEKFFVQNFALLSGYTIFVQTFRNPIVFYEYSKTSKMIQNEFDIKILDEEGCQIKAYKAKTYEAIEQVFTKSTRFSALISWTTDNTRNCMSKLEFEVKRTFHHDCRILKRSPKNFDAIDPNPENLYVTNLVKVELVSKNDVTKLF